jgi:hypothetical protein
MNCSDVLNFLCAYRDQELSESDRQSVEQHLTKCAACAEAMKELTDVSVRLFSLPAAEPAPDLAGRITSRLLGNAQPQSLDPPRPNLAAAEAMKAGAPVILSMRQSSEAEHPAMEHSLRNDVPHILLISQKVKDIKLRYNRELATQAAELRRLLRGYRRAV